MPPKQHISHPCPAAYIHIQNQWNVIVLSHNINSLKCRKKYTNGILNPYKNSIKHSWHQHDDVIKWKHFLCYWSFVRGIHRWPVKSPYKGQWCGALIFSLIGAWINGWVNNRESGDLRRHCAHYYVTVMKWNHSKQLQRGLETHMSLWGPNLLHQVIKVNDQRVKCLQQYDKHHQLVRVKLMRWKVIEKNRSKRVMTAHVNSDFFIWWCQYKETISPGQSVRILQLPVEQIFTNMISILSQGFCFMKH